MTDKIASELLSFATGIAEEGRAIINEARRSAPNVDFKADESFVTATDRAVEARLRERIQAAYPEHGILGEEYGSTQLDNEFVWVLDPIDGTAAFVAGIPVYGILIGVARAGRPWLGVVDFPATGERLTGIAGEWAEHDGQRIRTRACGSLKQAYLTSSNPRFLNPEESAALARLDREVSFTQYGGSCYSYCCLARGRTDIAVDGSFDAYDLFASTAIIEGAGGIVTDWSGNRLDISWKGGVIAAGDRRMHEMGLERLNATS